MALAVTVQNLNTFRPAVLLIFQVLHAKMMDLELEQSVKKSLSHQMECWLELSNTKDVRLR